MRTILIFRLYFFSFYEGLPETVQKKIDWTIGLVRDLPRIPEKFFKHIEGTSGLYKIRVQAGSNIFRIFCFFDEGNIIVLGNGFQKKTQKTPRDEINLALKIMKEYFDEKK